MELYGSLVLHRGWTCVGEVGADEPRTLVLGEAPLKYHPCAVLVLTPAVIRLVDSTWWAV